MRKLFLITGVVLILISLGLMVRSQFFQKNAGLTVQSDPQATVYINNIQAGVTPLSIQRKEGDVIVKLVPVSLNNSDMVPYETKISLVGGIETVLRHSFGPNEEAWAGDLLSFEKVGGKTASLTVVSSPDAGQVEVDNQIIGFAPIKIDSVGPGDHTIQIVAPGYLTREIPVIPVVGYRLTVSVKLARQTEEATASMQLETPKNIAVEILPTPTGFLRVRSEPSTAASESGKATPGNRYKFIDEDEKHQWFKIEYEAGKEGWVSVQYTKKVEE